MSRSWLSLLASALSLGLVLALAGAPEAAAADERLRLLGEYSFPSGLDFQGTTVGGLSGIAYDAERNLYYVVSDDRGELQPPRFYGLEIDADLTGISDVRVVAVTTLDADASAEGIQPYEENGADSEDIVLAPSGDLIVSSERDPQRRPWLRRFGLDGGLIGELPIPERFVPASQPSPDGASVQVRGVRNNLGFEGVALSADGGALYVANEEALAQDGPLSGLDAGTVVRVLRYDLSPSGWQPAAEVAYQTEKIFAAPEPSGAPAVNGVSTMLAVGHLWPEFDLLVMERAFSTGVGNDVWLFGVQLAGAHSTAEMPALPSPFTGVPASKTPLLRMSDIGVTADNLEGMTYGPALPNGKPSLIIVSDDNFSTAGAVQVNQFLLFELSGTLAEQPPAAAP
jgi:hypothetical protein